MAYFPSYTKVDTFPVGITERQSWPLVVIMGLQHLISCFGGTVLMPLLMGFNPNTSLFFGAIGSLLFFAITAGRIPAYLGSSAAFLAVIQAATNYSGIGLNPRMDVALGGIFVTGCVYLAIALVVILFGVKTIEFIFPPVVTGSIVMAIGLTLAPIAIQQASSTPDAPWQAVTTVIIISIVTVFGRGLIQKLPIVMGVVGGYSITAIVSIWHPSARPDLGSMNAAAWFGFPTITYPKFEANAIAIMVPVVIVFVAENIGHVKAISSLANTNLDKYIGRALAGDAIATIIAASFGGTGVTTYAENIAVLAVNRVYSSLNFIVTCAIAIILSMSPKLGAFLYTIPPGVLGGLSIVLFGTIAATGTD